MMAMINLLDKNTIDKIAAGEVVDRPASVVKELLENAIDAKANAVTVEIKEGGISLIRITDNGEGITKNDIKNAFLRHATSKIATAEDLLCVHSLGFRGEALSSIAAVSQVECISKTRDELVGVRYVIEGGEEKAIEEVGAPFGTTFIVKNLFYNTPARRKFLKTAATEASYISNIIERIALSHPEVSVRFIVNSQTKLHTSGNGKLKDIIYTIFGKEICGNMMEISGDTKDMKLTGYIGKPVIVRGNKNNMIYFINGRYIRNKVIYSAIEEAYKPYIMPHNYPFCVLNFEIAPSLIDVNVHPSKMEIRFENQIELFNFFYDTLRGQLSKRELIPEVKENHRSIVAENRPAYVVSSQVPVRPAEPFETKRIEMEKKQEKELASEKNNENEKELTSEKNNENEKEHTSELNKERETEPATELNKERETELTREHEKENKAENEITSESTPNKNDGESSVSLMGNSQGQLDLFDGHFISKSERIRHKMIGQLFGTYWLIEYADNLYIIDQHAAHEKVLYEKTMRRLKNKEFTSQQLNPPIILTLSMAEEELLNRFMDNFNELGYEIEAFGGREYAVRAVPDNLYAIGSEQLLRSLIDGLNENSVQLKSDLITEKIASMSCKAAVKGNHRLSFKEADALIEQLLELENPYNCPHGRPTIISMSKYEIEKKFKRIL